MSHTSGAPCKFPTSAPNTTLLNPDERVERVEHKLALVCSTRPGRSASCLSQHTWRASIEEWPTLQLRRCWPAFLYPSPALTAAVEQVSPPAHRFWVSLALQAQTSQLKSPLLRAPASRPAFPVTRC